jgi:osmotically-inducible protein OsmY
MTSHQPITLQCPLQAIANCVFAIRVSPSTLCRQASCREFLPARESQSTSGVKQGWITLSGHVSYGYQKTVAEGAVRYLLGVKGVFNEIEVRPEVKAMDVKQKIQNAFQRQASLDAKGINVNVDDSAVVLQGTVHSWRERDDAAIAAWAAPGVTRVENKLH